MERKSFENKLYIPRDVEGRPNREALNELRKVEEYLKEKFFGGEKKLVGLAPFGSIMGGYSTESSDIDAIILYDGPRESLEDMRKEFLAIREDVSKKFNVPGSKDVQTQARNLNPDGIFDHVAEGGPESGFFTGALADMSRLVTGAEIHHYRKIYKEKFKSLPKDIQKRIIDLALDEFLMDQDEKSVHKLIKRIRSIEKPTQTDVDESLEKRRKLWRKRLESLWVK